MKRLILNIFAIFFVLNSYSQNTELVGVTLLNGDTTVFPVKYIDKVYFAFGNSQIRSAFNGYDLTIQESLNDLLIQNCGHFVELSPIIGENFLVPKENIRRVDQNDVGNIEVIIGYSRPERIITDQSMSELYSQLTNCYLETSEENDSLYTMFEIVSDYNELRALQHVDTDSVAYVKDFIYEIDGVEYVTEGGVFYYTGCSENGSTCISGWQRDFNGVDYNPDWFVVNGYDALGNPYVVQETGISSDWERVIGISYVAGDGATINLPKDRTYLFDERSDVNDNVKYVGHNTTIKRKATPDIFLVEDVGIGVTTFDVDDASELRLGQLIGIVSGVNFDQNDGNANMSITAISGNTVTVSNGPNNAMSNGDRVIVKADGFVNISGTQYDAVSFEGINFDGNKDFNQYTVDWRYNSNININQVGRVLIERCIFKNTPSENIFVSVATIRDCYAENLNGSFVHFSNSATAQFASMIINCSGSGFNLATQAAMNHSEGLIVMSFNSMDITVSNCHFKNGKEAVLSPINSDDGPRFNINIFDSTFTEWDNNDNTGNLLLLTTSTTNSGFERLRIIGNEFENCGDISISGNDIREQEGINDIVISKNQFTNSRIFMDEVSNVTLFDNEFKYEEGPTFSGFSSANNSFNGAMIHVQSMDRVLIDKNKISGPMEIPGSEVVGNGIFVWVDLNGYRKDTLGNNTRYYYPQNIKVVNNTVANFPRGITVDNTHAGSYEGSTIGWNFSGNTINGPRDETFVGTGWGMQVPPGAVCTDNDLYVTYVNNNYFPIRAYGVHAESTPALADSLQGAIVRDNNIIGLGIRSIAVGSSVTSRSRHNCLVEGNTILAAITDYSGGNSTVVDNFVRAVSLKPEVQEVAENKEEY